MSKIDLSKACNAVFGPKPEKETPERVAYSMAKIYMEQAIDHAERLKQGEDIDKHDKNIIRLALNFGISHDYDHFPKKVKKELRAINNRFHQRYKKEIHCLQRGLKQ